MIFGGEFVQGIDLIDISLWAFTIFFFALVLFLQREGRREGYPLESDTTGKLENDGIFWFPPKKTFKLPNNRGEVTVPHGKRDMREHSMARTAVWPGAPYQPKGDPMLAGVGPGSFAEREDVPDLTDDGRNRIVPFRVNSEYTVAEEDLDPRGLTIYGDDNKPGGKVIDLWIDQSEAIIRYLEIDAAGQNVLVPVPFVRINREKKRVDVHAVNGEHFANAPKTKTPDAVTRLEEDMIAGYYGGGTLYANWRRAEPLL